MTTQGTHVVREHALLIAGGAVAEKPEPSLDRAWISESAFEWLLALNQRVRSSGAELVQQDGRKSLRLDNYVGYLQTQCGTQIEILPKHHGSGDSVESTRRLLQRMILNAMDLPTRTTDAASLQVSNSPLPEWLAAQFLRELDTLVRRGVRFQYERVEEERRFLRGQLDVAQAIRQRPDRRHLFPIRHDLHTPSRPENRLLRSCLDHIVRHSRDAGNWRRASELRELFSEVPRSANVPLDFSRWGRDRLVAHYQAIRPWCQLILREQAPLAVRGGWEGISLLFPMEKLFERYVGTWLRKRLRRGAVLRAPAASRYLCEHDGRSLFRLEPDFLIEYQAKSWILDAKWKRLNNDASQKHGISQGDLYQLFAYGQHYLHGQGEMFLVYPKVDGFPELAAFKMKEALELCAVAFDLEAEAGISPQKRRTLPLRTGPAD